MATLIPYRQHDPKAVTMDRTGSIDAVAIARSELAAMEGISDLLAQLPDAAARKRVLHWVDAIFRQDAPGPAAMPTPTPLHMVQPAVSRESNVDASEEDSLSVGDLEDWFESPRTPPPDEPDVPGPPDAAAADPDPPDEPATTLDAGAGEPGAADPDEAVEELGDRIRSLVARNDGQLQRCYSQAAKAYTPDQPLEGEVAIGFEVMPTGEARNVRSVRNTTGSDQLAQCLVAVVAGWSFPQTALPGPVEFVWPFRFRGQS